jgi:hypothetical protein
MRFSLEHNPSALGETNGTDHQRRSHECVDVVLKSHWGKLGIGTALN